MKGNIQHPTSNAEPPMKRRAGEYIGRWMLSVGRWILLLITFITFSVSAQTSTNLLPPLAPPYGEMPPTFWEQHGTALLVAGFVFIAMVGVVCWLVFRPKPPVPMPPEVLARETLTRLLHQPEDGRALSEISQTLRRYIIVAFELPSGERTTGEFAAALTGSQKIGEELGLAISSFLRECDQRKFSPTSPSTPLNAAAGALKLVDQAEQRRAFRDVPDPVVAATVKT